MQSTIHLITALSQLESTNPCTPPRVASPTGACRAQDPSRLVQTPQIMATPPAWVARLWALPGLTAEEIATAQVQVERMEPELRDVALPVDQAFAVVLVKERLRAAQGLFVSTQLHLWSAAAALAN